MRISHSKSGFYMQLTEAERQLLGDRVELSIYPKENESFLFLRPVLAGGRAVCKNTGNLKIYPWRMQWENLPEMKDIPYFGGEEVKLVPKGIGFAAPRPSMTAAASNRYPSARIADKRNSTACSAEALGGLEDLVDGINECKRRLGGNLIMEVTQDGFLRTLVQFGRK